LRMAGRPATSDRLPALSAVGIGLAGAFERDLVLRDFSAFMDGWSLGSGIGLRLRGADARLGGYRPGACGLLIGVIIVVS
jgi:hypothetical protein